MFHRKLFPNSTSPANQTICSDYEEDCLTYVDPDAIPLPSPSFPSPTPVSSQSISPYVIIVIVMLVGIFLLVSFSAVVMKYWSSCRTFFRRRTQSVRSNVAEQEDLEYQDLDRGIVDSEIDHPIWLIRTVGLQQTIINSITVIKFKKGEKELIETSDCSVCLSEFQDGETLRVLPKCNHAFHISCIDTWLRSHTNCPLCRAGIVTNPGRPSLASTNDQGFGDSRRMELIHNMEGSDNDVVSTSRYSNTRSSEVADNRVGAAEAVGEGFELVDLDHDQIKVDLDTLNRQNSNFNNHHGLNDELHLVRRSISMEHHPAVPLKSHLGNASSSTSDGNAALNPRLTGSSSLAQARPVPMRRSSSWCGRVSSERYDRASNLKLSP